MLWMKMPYNIGKDTHSLEFEREMTIYNYPQCMNRYFILKFAVHAE